MKISLSVNGQDRSVDAPPLARLMDVLREQLGLMGTKEGCGEGECGTCTVLFDGEPANACLIPVGQCAGHQIVTIEGVVDPAKPSPLAEAFVTRGGAQCGICTPGMIVSAHALLLRTKRPSEDDIREALAGNLCRCTGYTGIVRAVEAAADAHAAQGGER